MRLRPKAPARDDTEKAVLSVECAPAVQMAHDAVFTRLERKRAKERWKRDAEKISEFEARGITQYTISAHVPGDLIKFYGVEGTGFFRYFYPTDDGDTKFGDEHRNGEARHFPFEVEAMHACTEQLAKAVGIKVYGGDCIVGEDGSFCIIDFNDWPSFSRCREDAATAIALIVK